jgi:hypothetical protein
MSSGCLNFYVLNLKISNFLDSKFGSDITDLHSEWVSGIRFHVHWEIFSSFRLFSFCWFILRPDFARKCSSMPHIISTYCCTAFFLLIDHKITNCITIINFDIGSQRIWFTSYDRTVRNTALGPPASEAVRVLPSFLRKCEHKTNILFISRRPVKYIFFNS